MAKDAAFRDEPIDLGLPSARLAIPCLAQRRRRRLGAWRWRDDDRIGRGDHLGLVYKRTRLRAVGIILTRCLSLLGRGVQV